jgi:hypothetical protein
MPPSIFLREPQKIPQVMSPDETRRVLAVATSLKARVALSLCYAGVGQVHLETADVIRGGRVRRPLEKCRKPLAAATI